MGHLCAFAPTRIRVYFRAVMRRARVDAPSADGRVDPQVGEPRPRANQREGGDARSVEGRPGGAGSRLSARRTWCLEPGARVH